MSEQVCLPTNHLLIIFCVFTGFAVWYIHNDRKKHINDPFYNFNDNSLNKITKTLKNIDGKINQGDVNYVSDIELNNEDIERRNFLEYRDNKVIYDVTMPPERRQPEHAYPYRYVKNQINIPTRGLPDNYHMVGVVLRNNTESAFNLFGRQTYPGSNQWEYYVQGSMHNNDVKLPLAIKGDKEIEDGQHIMIPGMNPSKGEFKVKLYKYDAPRYIPLI